MSSHITSVDSPGKPIVADSTNTLKLDALRTPDDNPRIVRLFHRWREPPHTTEEAIGLLREAIRKADTGHDSYVLLAPAGLFSVSWPTPTEMRMPNADEFAEITASAQRFASTIYGMLPSASRRVVVVFGIDVSAARVHSPENRCAVGQFAAVLSSSGSTPLLIPKRFPTSAENNFVHVPDPSEIGPEVVFPTPLGPAAVLVCHDLNAYSPRGVATTFTEKRRKWRTDLRSQVSVSNLTFGLHLAHYVEAAASFRQSYGAWVREVGKPLFGSSQLPSDVTVDKARNLADSLISNPDEWPVLDLCEKR